MKFKHLVIGLIVLSIGGLIFYRVTKNNHEKEKGNDKKSTMLVEGVIVKEQNFSNTISLSGSIEANENLEIRSEVSGVVEKIYFSEGSQVTKGQTLIKINDIELRAQLAQAKTRENLASENERRAKLLLQKEAISQEEYDIASADWKTARAQTQLIQAQIGKTIIKAPFSGKIGLRNISPGAYVTPTTIISSLVNANPIKITFSIPEKYASETEKGSQLKFTVSGNKDIYTAKIYAVEPSIEMATRTLKVRALADNAFGKLIPGTFAKVELPLKNIKNAILIPSEVVIPIQDGKKVFIAHKGKAKEVKIETLTRTGTDVVVTSGLNIGDTLLVSGVMALKNEAEINVKLKNK